MITKTFFDKYKSEDIHLFTLKGDNIEVGIIEYGATINFIKFDGIDVELTYKDCQDYIDNASYCGGTIGRVGNRIAEGVFTLNGKEYHVAVNNGKNHLHGGIEGFDKKIFKSEVQEDKLVMTYLSKDMEEGYPGNLSLKVTYSVKGNTLFVDYEATSDQDTLWSPTNHAYFNLDGQEKGYCHNNLLMINADYYNPVDANLIPDEKKSVEGTIFDFRKLKKIATDIDNEELKSFAGYDHNFICNDSLICEARSTLTNIGMKIYSNLPGAQFYSGGPAKRGFAIEPQLVPNAINNNKYTKPILHKDEVKKEYIEYSFFKVN